MFYFWWGVRPITHHHPGNSLCGHGLCQEAEATGRHQVVGDLVTHALSGAGHENTVCIHKPRR